MLKKTNSWLCKGKASCAKHVKTLKKACAVLIAATLVLGAAIEAPQIHRDWLRNKVGKDVVMIVKTDPAGKILGGGSGFQIEAPSGNKYLLTNAHVCEAFAPAQEIQVQLPDGKIIPRKIIEISGETDLCLAEAVPGHDGLELAGWVDKGELLDLIGHPSLQPLTISEGEWVGKEEVKLLTGIVGFDIEAKECVKPKNRLETIDTIFGPLEVCLTVVQAEKTTIIALPGNSGSPIVNKWGHVVGVLFAGPGGERANWGLMITLKDIRAFLASY